MQRFEDLLIWQDAWKLFDELYWIFWHKRFTHVYFKEQILSAALSISNNIAEWYETKTPNERKQFFNYAKRSCGEVRNMLHRAKNCAMLTEEQFAYFYNMTTKVSVMIYKFMKTIS